MKIDKTVWKETFYVALGTVFLSAIMIAIYCAITPFNLKMLYGALFGSVAAILNFFFMAYTLQKAMDIKSESNDNEEDKKEKEEKIKLRVKVYYSIRSILYVLSLALGLISGFFDVYTLLLPALFPTIIARIRMFWLNKHGE